MTKLIVAFRDFVNAPKNTFTDINTCKDCGKENLILMISKEKIITERCKLILKAR
jgi:hypothetical protein